MCKNCEMSDTLGNNFPRRFSPFVLVILVLCTNLRGVVSSPSPQGYFSPKGGSSDEWGEVPTMMSSTSRGGVSTGGRGQSPPPSSYSSSSCTSIPQNFTLCKNIGYPKMMVPNLLGHDSLQEAEYHAKSWVPLLGLQCHPDTQLFLCSLFAPICLDRPIYPCRSLCLGVQAKCEPRMLAYNYPWPSMLSCDQFPPDHDLCIKLGAAKNPQTIDEEPDCPACNQAHTCENIVDHFCRSDFVFRAKLQVVSGLSLDFRRGKWFKPRGNGGGGGGGRRGDLDFRDVTLEGKEDCCGGKVRPGGVYLVMGVKRESQQVATFIMPWNNNDKVLKNAVRTFRSMDCSNPLPMSVGAEGDGNSTSSLRVTSSSRRKRRRGGQNQRGRGGRERDQGGGAPLINGGCRVFPQSATF